MDAIFGILHLDDTLVHETLLERMASAFEVVPERQSALSISRRGPIGCGRLTIGKTPVASPPTEMEDLLCVSDTRLYRAPDTNVPLDMSTSTRESLLSGLHARFGDEAPNQLEGDFAYAIWDKNRRNLKLVRDHMGVRPLFYFFKPGKFILWASHSDFILGSELVPNDLNVAAACRDWVGDTSDMEATAIHGLKRLPAAHILNVSAAGQIQLKRYWSLECTNPISDASNFNQSALRLRQLLDNAVGRRLSRSESIGAHLSGGLDSAAISVLAARALGGEKRPLCTYSFVSEFRQAVQFVDERPYIDATVQGEPNIYNTKISPPDHGQENVAGVSDRLGGYCGAEEKILRAATVDTVDVVFSGWGGDEVVSFNGRGTYAEYFLHGRWRKLWQELNLRASILGTTRTSTFANEVIGYVLPRRLANLMRGVFGKAPASMANEQLCAMLRPPYRNMMRPLQINAASARRNRLTLFHNGSVAYRLENWALQGMHYGIQYTFPMLDRDLLEYSIRLPASYFIHRGLGRKIFREAMKGVLPESVRTCRPKLESFPCSLLRLAEHKAEYQEELAVLRQDPKLSQVLDFEAIEAALSEIPDPDAVTAAFNAEAAGGKSPSLAPTLALEPLVFARSLKARLER